MDNSHVESILLVADDLGRVFTFLDGTFSLGYFAITESTIFAAPTKHPECCLFVTHPTVLEGENSRQSLLPTVVELPLLAKREARDFANLATAGRALAHYSMRVVTEMREAWFGTESNTGARDFGPKWIKTLSVKQKEQYGGMSTPLRV